MDAKKLDEALHIVRSGIAEIEKMKVAADRYVEEKQKVASEIDGEIASKQQVLKEVEVRLAAAKQAEQAHIAKVQKALGELKAVV